VHAPPCAHVPEIRLCVLAERDELAAVRQPPEGPHARVGLHVADDLAGTGAPVDEVHVSTAAGDGEDISAAVERAHVHAEVRRRVVAICKRRAPQPARRPRCSPRLQIVCVIERAVAGEKDGGTGGMELRVGDGQRGDVKGLQMRVGVSVNLWIFLRFWESCQGESEKVTTPRVSLSKEKAREKNQTRTLNNRIRRSELATSNMETCEEG